MLSSVIRWSLAAAAVLAVPQISSAQNAASQPGQGADQSLTGYQPTTAYPEATQTGGYFYPGVELRALPSARANAAVAWAQYRRAETYLSLLVNDASRKYKRSDELKNAKAEEQAAWESLNAVRAEATASVKADESYKASLALQRRLEKQIQDLRASDDAPLDRLITLATLKVSYSATSSAMEAAAVAADPRVKSARQRLVDASKRVSDLRQQYDDTVRNDPQIIAARRSLEDARIMALGAGTTWIEANRVANIGLDFAYGLNQGPYSNNIYNSGYGNPYGPYGYGNLGYGYNNGIGFGMGYPYRR